MTLLNMGRFRRALGVFDHLSVIRICFLLVLGFLFVLILTDFGSLFEFRPTNERVSANVAQTSFERILPGISAKEVKDILGREPDAYKADEGASDLKVAGARHAAYWSRGTNFITVWFDPDERVVGVSFRHRVPDVTPLEKAVAWVRELIDRITN
jgi:hypothetical protein